MKHRAFVLVLGALTAFGCGGDDAAGGGGGAVDITAPSFAGLESATADGDNRVVLTWQPATDDQSAAGRIAYRIYASTTADDPDFTTPFAVTPAGANGAELSSVRAGTIYKFAVRAVDAAGNEEQNTVLKEAETPDTTPPEFAGVTGATAVGSTQVLVQWKDATDNGDPAFRIKYRIYVADSPTGHDFSTPNLTSSPGANSATVTGLSPEKQHYVVVRAVDTHLQEDSNTKALEATTPEGVPPTFAGAVRAVAAGTSITVSWTPASDNVSASSEIRYRVYQAEAPGAENLAKPTVETTGGASSVTIDGLASDKDYYYVVHAVDLVGNEDTNNREVSARTAPPDVTAPTFGGAEAVTAESPSTLRVSWNAATDDSTPSEKLSYDIYVANSASGEDFSSPSFSSAPGQRSFLITNLMPNSARFVVVRARDLSGNQDTNSVEQTATTLANTSNDNSPPSFAGPVSLTRVNSNPDKLLVSYSAGTDDTSAAVDLRYHACVGLTAQDCMGASFYAGINASSNWGATAFFVQGLAGRTQYRVSVRAEDRAGNFSSADSSALGTTATSFNENVMPYLDTRCNACHSYSYGTIVNVPSSYDDASLGILKLVSPGSPANSYLYRKTRERDSSELPFSMAAPNTYSDARMPADGTDPFDTAVDSILRDWIAQGAFDN